jgi:diguanylate cyclase (GGDEF)-like protein
LLALVRDEAGVPMFYVSQFQDITKAREIRSELQRRATHDALTGLINREELGRRVEQGLEPTVHHVAGLAVLYCDLDHFKAVNDSYGHAVGDVVLQLTAQRIASALRTVDEVARLGGDEFVVLLSNVTDTGTALDVAGRIRAAVAEPMVVERHTLVVTLSVGVSVAQAGAEAHQLLRDADQALYQAKDGGRDRAVAAAPR